MRIRPRNTSGLATPYGRRSQGVPILGDATWLGTWADGAFFAADLIENKVRLKGAVTPLASVSGISIARASTAYYCNSAGVLSSFASGAARIGDRGLLVEPAATNLALQSQTFDNASWSKSNSTVTANAVAAPDGTTTADKLIPSAAATDGRIIQTVAGLSSGGTYTLSCYGKAGEHSNFRIYMDDSGSNSASVSYNLSTGAVSTAAAVAGTWTAVSTTVTALANGWYRCTVTFTATSAAPTRAAIWCRDTGDGTSGIYLWGAQLEATAYATSYIPTTTASATRAADVISIGSVTGLSYPMTLYAEFERASDLGGNEWLLQVDEGSANERAVLRVNSSDQLSSLTVAGGVQQSGEAVTGALAIGTVYRGAVRIATDDIKAAVSGSLSSGDTSCTNPSSPTSIRIGSSQTGGTGFAGYLRKLGIYPSAYTDAQLQAITPA